MQNVEESIVEASFLCPSFSTYSSNNINDIADQVTHENDNFNTQNDTDENDFEFVAFQKATDETFHHHRHSASNVFPIFNRELLSDEDDDGAVSDTEAIHIPLRKLLIGDEKRDSDPLPSLSVSLSEDNLEVVPASNYCLWTPKSPQASPSKFNFCKKSNSTGSSSSSSSKRWKFLGLLRRSKSDGKESLAVLTPPYPSESPLLGLKKEVKDVNSKKKSDENKDSKVARKKIPATVNKIPASAVYEALYGRKREIRRTSYLPYKQHLVGFGVTSNFNSTGRGFPLHF